MVKLLLFLIFIGCTGFGASWLMENSGTVTMIFLDYRIDTSVAFLLISAIIFAVLSAFLLQIIFAPSRFFERRAAKKLKRGIDELTYSVAALAASDIHTAELHTKKLEKLLGKTPLAILLSAQIAKTKGDELATNALLEQLLLHKETNYLAARSLSDNASKNNNLPKALVLAKQANQINPKDNLSALQVLNLQVRMKNWEEAEATLQSSKLPRKEKNRLRALINIVRGRELLADGYNEQALHLAKYAAAKLPNFLPAAEFAASANLANNQPKKADKILKNIKENKDFWHCRICANSQKIWDLHCDHCHGFDTLT